MKSLGLCIGASSISMAVVEKGKNATTVIEAKSIPHEGNPRKVIKELVTKELLEEVEGFAVTGRKLRHMLAATSISEPEALESAYIYHKVRNGNASEHEEIIVSAGGETFMVYDMDQSGRIVDVFTGNKCASGTGEFFLQQLKRMDMSIENAIDKADIENPYKVAGRCSVFCKSDCTHALNKGAPKERVVAGLCEMMASKILELLKKTENKNVLLVGGTADNSVMVSFLRKKQINVAVPDHARCFEALGAAIWALDNSTQKIADPHHLFVEGESSFSFLPSLKDHVSKVQFKEVNREKASLGDKCIIGLDVGSTTTKAVLIRERDRAILASCYLRTNGDPIGAARKCYTEIGKQQDCRVEIIGLGVTGSGRQIAGLHALTPAVINEIIAHAAAASYFDPEVDTIFEIGGQDAKYTYITNGVPSDYAMNEACSAGTGSFLEEAAKESLNIDTEEIGNIAMRSTKAPNFNDQCAAFIGSDIKSAIQMGIEPYDIAAGLVYSICMNYANRVKGSRTVGRKVFMQGGVCYNKAVPVAMAALLDKEIIVPPEPGLMGAFGVALEVSNKLELKLLEPMSFDIHELAGREVVYKEPFVCAGGAEKCDRKCSISRIVIEGRTYPFGGACYKYYNTLTDKKQKDDEKAEFDLVAYRERLVFEKYAKERGKMLVPPNGKTVGINNSLMTNTLYPLYYNFFTALGYNVMYSETIDREGMERKGSSFCYPVEIAHGSMEELIRRDPDIYFLPHVKSMPVQNGIKASVTCPFVQSEPYYIKTAFEELKDKTVLIPVLDMAGGYESEKRTFLKLGEELGFGGDICEKAFEIAVQAQKDFVADCQATGRKFLMELEKNPDEIAVVLFGRPYNAFAKAANMGIPQKFSSRGYRIIPHDFLPYSEEEPVENMYWAMGQIILKASKYAQKHKQLYGVFITNFSCGPDSFVISYFRSNMGGKPSLTLELDSHTADAGVDTRIEAFLDVVKSYIEINKGKGEERPSSFTPARISSLRGETIMVDSSGKEYRLTDPKVHVIVPSMGDVGSRLLASTLRFVGVKSTALPEPTEKELKIGRGYSSCKECLPLILTIGSLIDYLENRKDKEERLIYFMPETSGPCRFGQYNVLMKNVISKLQIENVALLSLTSENSYAGFGTRFALRAWQSVIIADVLEEVYSAIKVMAKDKEKALVLYDEICREIEKSVEQDSWSRLIKTLQQSAAKLKTLEKKFDIHDVPKVALVGEIYVRRDDFSRQYLVDKLAARDIIVKVAPIAEWLYYCDYIVKNKLVVHSTLMDRIKTYIQGYFKNPFEKTIKSAMEKSGFYEGHMIDVDKVVGNVSDLVSPRLTGETVLTVGSAITEVVEEVDGVISIGPFGCMPGRIAEAVISETINDKKLQIAEDKELVKKVMEHHPALPFLSIETDGNVFPQIIEARLENFCLQVGRVHKKILQLGARGRK